MSRRLTGRCVGGGRRCGRAPVRHPTREGRYGGSRALEEGHKQQARAAQGRRGVRAGGQAREDKKEAEPTGRGNACEETGGKRRAEDVIGCRYIIRYGSEIYVKRWTVWLTRSASLVSRSGCAIRIALLATHISLGSRIACIPVTLAMSQPPRVRKRDRLLGLFRPSNPRNAPASSAPPAAQVCAVSFGQGRHPS
jgi:hypothetical protein